MFHTGSRHSLHRKTRKAPRRQGHSLILEALEDRCLLSAAAGYGQLPLAFEPNVGQGAASVNYLARGPGYDISLMDGRSALWLRPSASGAGEVVSTSLVGAEPTAAPQALDKLPGVANYLVGNDPSQWHTNVPLYGEVAYAAVYPGVDLLYHAAGAQFEYDFAAKPGSSVGAIRLQVAGAASMSLDARGDLVLHTPGGDLIEKAPSAYQMINGSQQNVAVRYVLRNDNQFGFAVGAYDATRPLVIDPTIDYSTYLGGSTADTANAVAADAAGNAYITGNTASSDFPTANPLQGPLRGTQNTFIAKVNPSGTALVYATYLGGSGSDSGSAIAVDAAGDVSVTGTTTSSNFPTVNALQSTLLGHTDGFVVRLNTAGNQLLFASYLGGGDAADSTFSTGIAADNNGHVYVSGDTSATNFPTTSGAFQTAFGDKVFAGSSDGGITWAASAALPNSTIRAEAINPQSPSTLYAGGSGGLLKSSDRGVHWTALTNGLPSGFAPVQIVVNPTTTTTVYAMSTSQIFKSTDSGANWTAASSGLPANPMLTGLAIDSANPVTLYAASNGSGIFKTTNGGSSWSAVNSGLPNLLVQALAFAPGPPSALYAGLSSSGDALAKSTDGGSTWVPLSGLTNFFVASLVVNPQQANTLYTMVQNQRQNISTLMKSTDGGATFVDANTGLPSFLNPGPVVIDPVNPSIVYSISPGSPGQAAVFSKSTNGGATWAPITNLTNVNVEIAVVDPTNDARLYVGADKASDLFVSELNTAGVPVLIYSTFLGGSAQDLTGGSNNTGNNIARDAAGNVFVTGRTTSPNFPTTAGAVQARLKGSGNATVTELNSAGSAIVYSTYLGGSGGDGGVAVAVDGADNAIVTGFTDSTDFPTLNPLQAHNTSQAGGFVTKLNASGKLVYSTYLTGSVFTQPQAVAVDAAGDAYVAGSTESSDFPTVNPFQGNLKGIENAFVSKINAAGSAFFYSSYLGGSTFDTANGIALDAMGNTYVVGATTSTDFPVENALQPSNHNSSGGETAFITKIIPWAAADVTVGADDKERVLWQGAGGTGNLGIVTSSNSFTAGPVYAPYGEWLARAAATGADSNIRILWSNPDGHTSVWVVGANGAFQQAVVFGPQAGWTAVGIAVGSDGVTRVLWSNVNGAAAVWQLNNSLALASATAYGPFSGWSVRSIAAGSSDGLVRLLWNNVNGSAALWLLNANGSFHSADVVGPISGWSAQDITVGTDNQTRFLWDSNQGQMVVWAITDSFGVTASPLFGPAAG